jgi:hypothetical protein
VIVGTRRCQLGWKSCTSAPSCSVAGSSISQVTEQTHRSGVMCRFQDRHGPERSGTSKYHSRYSAILDPDTQQPFFSIQCSPNPWRYSGPPEWFDIDLTMLLVLALNKGRPLRIWDARDCRHEARVQRGAASELYDASSCSARCWGPDQALTIRMGCRRLMGCWRRWLE